MGAPEGSFSSGSGEFNQESGDADEVSQFVNQKASGEGS